MIMSQRSVPTPFLTKTFELVGDSSTDDVISWTENGDTFVIWKNAEFAKDLLPKYFKHNNFSSFVRQLNTYGFRKTVPDKWEFANDNFKRDHKDLLCHIRRRKPVNLLPPPPPAALPDGASPFPSNSTGDDPGTTTSSKNSTASSVDDHHRNQTPGTTATLLAALAEENKRLKRNNEMLSSELTETKKRCDELVSFLTECLKVEPDKVDNIMQQLVADNGTPGDETATEHCVPGDRRCEDIEEEADPSRMKLFGIWLNDEEKNPSRKKRPREMI